jgi:uncharacterized protein (TIGR03083 family)
MSVRPDIVDESAAVEYRHARQRMVTLVQGLGDHALQTVVAACPAWTVKDLLAHVTGIAVDLSQGNRPQGDTQAWVDRQVEERRERSLTEVIDEWSTAASAFEAMIEARPDRWWGLTYDLVVHEHDLRTAVGDRAERTSSGVALAARLGLRLLAMDLASRQLPAVQVRIDGSDYVVGDAAPVATLTGSAFEVLRLLGSRRTLTELRQAAWSGDLDAVIDGLLHMDPPQQSLGE